MEKANKSYQLLFVEDDTSLQKILRDRLKEESVEVIEAKTGAEAITQLKSFLPNLILLDIMLPGGMNGFDILEQVKKDDKTKSIPVIVLTNLEGEQKSALSIGAIDYIVKPSLSIDELVLKIKNNLH